MKRLPSALVGLFAVFTGAACIPGVTGDTSGSSTCGGDMGATQGAARIEAFLGAATAFNQASVALERDTLASCQRMGRALGMSDADLAGSGQDGMRSVCSRVNQQFRAELTAVQQANVQVTIAAQPPQCQVSVDGYARCAAECEATVDPGSVQIQCQGGEIRGQCNAQCTGSCAVSVDAQCSGRCEGACEGTCSARNADGSCAGTCQGTCHGQCVVQSQASCSGECRGGCSVEFVRPYCTTQVEPARVSAECNAACDARLEAQATCQPGELFVGVSGNVDAVSARVARLRAATVEGLASAYTLSVRGQRLAASGADVVRMFPGAAQGAVAVSAQAAACMTSAASGVVQSMARVNVSVQVNVEVSASVSGSAG